MIGDLPEADAAPPPNMLFICKLNPGGQRSRRSRQGSRVWRCCAEKGPASNGRHGRGAGRAASSRRSSSKGSSVRRCWVTAVNQGTQHGCGGEEGREKGSKRPGDRCCHDLNKGVPSSAAAWRGATAARLHHCPAPPCRCSDDRRRFGNHFLTLWQHHSVRHHPVRALCCASGGAAAQRGCVPHRRRRSCPGAPLGANPERGAAPQSCARRHELAAGASQCDPLLRSCCGCSDWKTGESLNYGFIGFDTEEACEQVGCLQRLHGHAACRGALGRGVCAALCRWYKTNTAYPRFRLVGTAAFIGFFYGPPPIGRPTSR